MKKEHELYFKSKTVEYLLQILISHRWPKGRKMQPDWYESLLTYLQTIKLSAEESEKLNIILNADLETLEKIAERENIKEESTSSYAEVGLLDLAEKLNRKKENKSSFNAGNLTTEEKFDSNLIPTTKFMGIAGSVMGGIFYGFFAEFSDPLEGIFYCVYGIASTLGLCILLEGFSTVIKLLRKISERN